MLLRFQGLIKERVWIWFLPLGKEGSILISFMRASGNTKELERGSGTGQESPEEWSFSQDGLDLTTEKQTMVRTAMSAGGIQVSFFQLLFNHCWGQGQATACHSQAPPTRLDRTGPHPLSTHLGRGSLQ